jgi:flagellar hook-basal body complex protein FliE
MSLISSLTGIPVVPATPKVAALSSGTGPSFGSFMTSAVAQVNGAQQQATQAVDQFLHGTGELHTVALVAQKAEMAFDLAVQVRNKVISAYQEIMKIQL